jgi:hypothetical protein
MPSINISIVLTFALTFAAPQSSAHLLVRRAEPREASTAACASIHKDNTYVLTEKRWKGAHYWLSEDRQNVTPNNFSHETTARRPTKQILTCIYSKKTHQTIITCNDSKKTHQTNPHMRGQQEDPPNKSSHALTARRPTK